MSKSTNVSTHFCASSYRFRDIKNLNFDLQKVKVTVQFLQLHHSMANVKIRDKETGKPLEANLANLPKNRLYIMALLQKLISMITNIEITVNQQTYKGAVKLPDSTLL